MSLVSPGLVELPVGHCAVKDVFFFFPFSLQQCFADDREKTFENTSWSTYLRYVTMNRSLVYVLIFILIVFIIEVKTLSHGSFSFFTLRLDAIAVTAARLCCDYYFFFF